MSNLQSEFSKGVREDIPPLLWGADGLTAIPPGETGLPSFRIVQVLFGWRAYRGSGFWNRTHRMKSPEDCRRAINRSYNAQFEAMSRQSNLPMILAPRNGWSVIGVIRGDIAEHLGNEKFAGWANQQIVMFWNEQEKGWEMSAPQGLVGIPDDCFVGYRLLHLPMPPVNQMIRALPAPDLISDMDGDRKTSPVRGGEPA